jgi:uncharacterized protein
MPANLTPEYKATEAAFRKARDPRERLEHLREMLRVIPKHKGTDHLQADIKHRIKELSEELERPKKSGAHGGPPLVIQPQGAAQIALLGPPNTGKSSLHARLTNSGAQAAPYPFTTQYPEPGMMPFEDIHFQLVDLPAISPEHPVSWLAGALQTADGCLLVVDLSDPACVERIEALHAVLRVKRVTLTDRWEPQGGTVREATDVDEDPFALRLPAVLLANKADLLGDVDTELRAFLELTGDSLPGLCGIGDHRAKSGRDRFVAFPRTRHRARLHEGAWATAGPKPAVHAAPRANRGRRCVAGAQGSGALAKVRASMGQIRVRRTACRQRPSASRWRCGRIAHVKHWCNPWRCSGLC